MSYHKKFATLLGLLFVVVLPIGFAKKAKQTTQESLPVFSKEQKEKKREEKSMQETSSIKTFEPAVPKVIGMLPKGWEVVMLEEDYEIQTKSIALKNGKQATIRSNVFVLKPAKEEGACFVPEPVCFVGEKETTLGMLLTDFIEESKTRSGYLEGMTKALKQTLQSAPKPEKKNKKK